MTTELLIKITQDQKYEFFHLYDSLGDIQKKIWQATVWWCKRFPNAHPRQSKIAEKVGCCRKHVNRTFKKFQEFGWLSLISRGAKRAKMLFVPDSLIQIDVFKREYFKKVEITPEVTYSYSNKKKIASKPAGEIAVPQYLEKLKISWEDKLKLSLLPESIYHETLYQCRKRQEEGFKPDNAVKYLVGSAIGMAKQRGIEINWRGYYATIRSTALRL